MKPVLKNSILDTGVPPLSLNDNGEARRIGVEIEFGGLYLRDAVNLVITTLGGTAEIQRHNAWKVVGTKIGDLIVEIDADILQGNKPAGKKPNPRDSVTKLLADAEENAYRVAGEVSSSLVPLEIVTPPLEFKELDQLESVIDALRAAGAEGTSASFLNGFRLKSRNVYSPIFVRISRFVDSLVTNLCDQGWTFRIGTYKNAPLRCGLTVTISRYHSGRP